MIEAADYTNSVREIIKKGPFGDPIPGAFRKDKN
jgi:hypothetical protein